MKLTKRHKKIWYLQMKELKKDFLFPWDRANRMVLKKGLKVYFKQWLKNGEKPVYFSYPGSGLITTINFGK